MHGQPLLGSVAKLDRKQSRVLHNESQPHRLASERRNITTVFPAERFLDRVADEVTTVSQSEVGDRLAGQCILLSASVLATIGIRLIRVLS